MPHRFRLYLLLMMRDTSRHFSQQHIFILGGGKRHAGRGAIAASSGRILALWAGDTRRRELTDRRLSLIPTWHTSYAGFLFTRAPMIYLHTRQINNAQKVLDIIFGGCLGRGLDLLTLPVVKKS